MNLKKGFVYKVDFYSHFQIRDTDHFNGSSIFICTDILNDTLIKIKPLGKIRGNITTLSITGNKVFTELDSLSEFALTNPEYFL